ncbi:MAG: hypothetical protein ACYCWW_20205 [Deltaproteobacteria bacterium]
MRTSRARRPLPLPLRQTRGQAMVEYSMILWLLAFLFIMGWTTGAGNSIKKGPNGETPTDTQHHSAGVNASGHDSIFGLMVDSYQVYQDGYYYALSSTLP